MNKLSHLLYERPTVCTRLHVTVQFYISVVVVCEDLSRNKVNLFRESLLAILIMIDRSINTTVC